MLKTHAQKVLQDSPAQTLCPDPFPRRVTIELSGLCNLSCPVCPRRFVEATSGLMSRRLFEKILEEIGTNGTEAVVPFFRGEPLLHPSFLEMMHLLRKKTRARIQLATNAMLLSRPVAKGLLDLQIDVISFSLDALTTRTYEKVRPGGDFNRVMDNVHGFLNMRESLANSLTTVQVSATEGPDNQTEIVPFIAYWQGKADRVRIYARHSEGGKFGRLEHARPEESRKPCRKPFTDIVIYSDGQVALCNHDWDRKGEGTIGSVNEKTIQEIWEGPSYRKIRDKHLDRRWSELDPCRHCDHWQASDGRDSFVGRLVERAERMAHSAEPGR